MNDGPCVSYSLMVAHAEAARLRACIAELEARTVKLPKWDYWHGIWTTELIRRLDAAGVKWEEE